MLPNYNLLYVRSAARSRDFYCALLGQQPVEDSENFVLFVLPNGTKLGLWGEADVLPAPTLAGGFELGFAVGGPGDVDRLATEWKDQGMEIVQEPAEMDFGRTFTALDPDGHRLRVLWLDAAR